MKITFIRHATAQDRFLYPNDYERVLIKKGKTQSHILAQFCTQLQERPSLFLSSPYPRALQTAQIIANQVNACQEPQTVEWLRLDHDPKAVLDQIALWIEKDQDHQDTHVWMLGHEPNLSWIISQLLGSSQILIQVKKASMTQLELQDNGQFELVWSIPCQMMRTFLSA